MSSPEDAASSLAKAYSMSELLPIDEARVRSEVERVAACAEPVELGVGRLGLLKDGSLLEDVDGCMAELARDLGLVGVLELRIPSAVLPETVEAFIRSLRQSVGGDGGSRGPRELLQDLPEISFSFGEGGAVAGGGEVGIEGLFRDEDLPFAEDAGLREETGELGVDREEPKLPDLDGVVERYLEADADGRADLEEEVREAAEEAWRVGEVDLVAEAVERLALDGEAGPGALGPGEPGSEEAESLTLARELVLPGVASKLAIHLGAAREEEARERMIRATAALGGEMATVLSEALAQTDERAARRTYVDAMIALGEDGRAEAERMVDDPRWFVVRNGVAILGGVGTESDVQHLTSHLAHEDARVRRETVRSLARIGGDDAGLLLLGMVDDADPDVRASVATALGALGVEKAVKPLLQRLEKEEEQKVQVQILRALGALGDPGAVTAIEKRAVGSFFSRSPVPVRVAAYRALASIGTPHAMDLLEAALDDKDEDVRTIARSLLDPS